MAGNEVAVTKFLVANKGRVSLPHLGDVISVGAPAEVGGAYTEINSIAEAETLLATEDSRKKADIYVNGHGVSIKQKGGSFSFNRLQRASLLNVFSIANIPNPADVLKELDLEVARFHNDQLDARNRKWEDFFSESEFKALLKLLMMEWAPKGGYSTHPAGFILEAPANGIVLENVLVQSFDEYFNSYKPNFKIAIRRSWYGQASETEHGRARAIMGKADNAPWVFNSVSGQPDIHTSGSRWRDSVPSSERKTAYYLMIEKENTV